MTAPALLALGSDEQETDDLIAKFCSRDAERFALETSGGLFARLYYEVGGVRIILVCSGPIYTSSVKPS
jgi:hypothetical protein